MTEDRGSLPPGLAFSWGVQSVQRRGPKPAFSVDLYAERSWLLDVPVRGVPVPPNLLHWTKTLLEVMDDTGLSQHDALSCAVLFQRRVCGHPRLRLLSGSHPRRASRY